MDHLPRVQRPFHPNLKVPYLCTEEYSYDGLGGLDFPLRKGFTKEQFEQFIKGRFLPMPWEEALSFLQAWGFFGLLCETLGIAGVPVNQSDFVQKTEDGEYITTTPLRFYIQKWTQAARIQTVEVRLVQAQATYYFMEEMSHHLTSFAEPEELCGGNVFLANEPESERGVGSIAKIILLSAHILGEMLSTAWLHIYSNLNLQGDFFHWGATVFFNGFLDRLMLEAGWCPHDIAISSFQLTVFGNSIGYYLSSLNRQNSSRDHQSCSAAECVATQVDEKQYTTKHTSDCRGCTCQAGCVEVRELEALVSSSQIPIITFEEDRMRVRSACEQRPWHWPFGRAIQEHITRYVAISHVWSDGLGNLYENALPKCQLKRLQFYVDNLYPNEQHPVPFWIDSICVPVQNREFRKLAIKQMRRVYSKAEKVLVLDGELLRVSLDRSAEETMAWIDSACWNRRLWTLQEGALSQELYFRFLDGSTTVEDLRQSHHAASALSRTNGLYSPAIDDTLFEALASKQEQICNPYHQSSSREHSDRVDDIVDLIKWRSTSKLEDEAICIATILDCNVSKIVDAVPRERMKILLSSLRSIPANFLFADVPRYQEYGCRWMPMTFLNEGMRVIGPSSQSAHQRLPYGLSIQSVGLLLTPRASGISSPQGNSCNIIVHLPEFAGWSDRRLIRISSNETAQAQDISGWRQEGCSSWQAWIRRAENPAVIPCFEQIWANQDNQQMALILERFPEERINLAVLVTIRRKFANVLFCRFEALVYCDALFPESTTGRHVDGTFLVKTQSWAVG